MVTNCHRAKLLTKLGDCKVGTFLFVTDGDGYTYVMLVATLFCPVGKSVWLMVVLTGYIGFFKIKKVKLF